jgi:hypothetical protein
MLLVARKNLFSERTRLFISVGGIALSVFLISLLLSLYRGWDEKVGGFVENSNVDLWVANEGAEDFLTAASLLPTEEQRSGSSPALSERSRVRGRVEPHDCPALARVRVDRITEEGERIGTEMDIHFIGFDPVTRLEWPIEGCRRQRYAEPERSS